MDAPQCRILVSNNRQAHDINGAIRMQKDGGGKKESVNDINDPESGGEGHTVVGYLVTNSTMYASVRPKGNFCRNTKTVRTGYRMP